MDPEEGGGEPPPTRRSRRVQNLNPLPATDPNAIPTNDSVTVCVDDASASQYEPRYNPSVYQSLPLPHTSVPIARTPPTVQNEDDMSTIASVLMLPPLPSSSSMSDPPEQTFGLSTSTRSVHSEPRPTRSHHAQPSNITPHYHPALPPQTIQLNSDPTHPTMPTANPYITTH